MKISNLTKNLFEFTFLFFIFSIVFFGRPFTGIILFGFRLGEILVGVGLIVIFVIAIKLKSIKGFTNIFYTHLALVFLFMAYVFLNGLEQFDTYIFKSSSFIWMISYVYLGYFLSKIHNINNKSSS